MDVDALTGMVAGSAIVGLIIGVIGIVIFYFVVKAAVRNGTIEAHARVGLHSSGVTTSAGSVSQRDATLANPKTMVVCRRCGTFKKDVAHCPNCGSGWAGKKIDHATWNALQDVATNENKPIRTVLAEMVVCRCGTLKKRDESCPVCGAA